MQSDKLHDQLVQSIYSPHLNEMGGDIAEVAFDALLDEGILKDIPVIGTIVKLFKGAMDIRDRIFVTKVAKFLFQLSQCPEKDRQSFEEKTHTDASLKRKVGVTLVLLLDRLDDIEKPDLVAKCFGAYLSGNISFELFRRLAAAIDIAFIDDLKALCQEDTDLGPEERALIANLARTGLVDFRSSGAEGTWGEMGSMRYSLSPLGYQLVKIYKMQSQ